MRLPIRRYPASCWCDYPRDSGRHGTVEECSLLLVAAGRGPCDHPEEHHRWRPRRRAVLELYL